MKVQGFTLAELLIALAILGVIATFTIPKVLQSQQNNEWKAKAKEAAAILSASYEAYRLSNTPSSATTFADLTPFINYVRITTVNVDDIQTTGQMACDSTRTCLVLHNGGVIGYVPTRSFNGTATTNALSFGFDPDGKYSSSTTGPGKAVALYVYFNGRITDHGNLLPGTTNSSGLQTADPSLNPPWFSWD